MGVTTICGGCTATGIEHIARWRISASDFLALTAAYEKYASLALCRLP
jgi:hypothetical protein